MSAPKNIKETVTIAKTANMWNFIWKCLQKSRYFFKEAKDDEKPVKNEILIEIEKAGSKTLLKKSRK